MNLDVDYLIDFFNKNSEPNQDEETSELGEQDDASAASTGGSSGGGSVPKWSDSYQTKRGKANPLMSSGEKWNTGLARGSANQIW
jgi:hypothetical protein